MKRDIADCQLPAMDAADPAFWRHFGDHHWDRRACACNGKQMDEPPLAPQRMFDKVVRSCRPQPRGRREHGVSLRFHVFTPSRPLAVAAPKRRHLPRAEDGSFEGYRERISRQLNPWWRRMLRLPHRSFALAIDFPEAQDHDLWDWERRFLKPLVRHAGLNNGFTYSALFIGDHGKTSFSVQAGLESVFQIPIVGIVSVRTWPREFANTHPHIDGMEDYQACLEHSTLVAARPGGFVYRPAQDWHVSEPTHDGLSVSLVLSLVGFATDTSTVPQVGVAAAETVAARRPRTLAFDPCELQSTVQRIPAGLQMQPIEGYSMFANWLKFATGMGFARPPAPAGRQALHPAQELHGCDDWPIVYVEANTRMVVAVDGHVFLCPIRQDFKRVISLLNRPQAFSVETLLFGERADSTPQELSMFLQELCRARPRMIVEPAAAPAEAA